MSGPIVRRYGFPNFDKIFGEREIQHGVEGEIAGGSEAAAPGTASLASKPATSPSTKPGDQRVDPAPKPT